LAGAGGKVKFATSPQKVNLGRKVKRQIPSEDIYKFILPLLFPSSGTSY
jgi:hypothetical protein